jgi:class 3 adenylate cyclase/ATP/maltotriose-dependent transcriptional regulator MalT
VTDRLAMIVAARAAADEGRWFDAYTVFAEVDQTGLLDPDELELLASAATFSAKPDEATAARQRAFVLVRADQPRRAAGLAILLSLTHLARNSTAVGMGWAQQAKELLDDQGECEESVTFLVLEAMVARQTGHDDRALVAAEEIIVRAGRLGADDAKALATLLKGQILTMQGRVDEGAQLMDSAMALAVSGCLGEFASAYIFCGTISTCASSGDLDRAWEWTNEVGRCTVSGIAEYPGDCRMHRAEMLRIRGEWAKAELELASVCEEVGTWHVGHAAAAYYELGEVSLHRGDLEAAAHAFAECKELGHRALPGLASLELVRGNPETAVALLDEGLAAMSDRLGRSRLLHVAVEAQLTTGLVDEAGGAAAELTAMADQWKAPIHQARAATSAGLVAAARGERGVALDLLRTAVDWWRQVPAPYDEAVSRVALAGVEAPAARVVQLETALEAFVRLGATIDGERVLGLLGRGPSSERVAVAMMFTDIEGSTALLASLGDEAWLAVLRRHDATLRSLFATHRGEVFTGTGDGFFVGFPSVDSAFACAVAIQAAMDDVRVRIGVHFAEVSRDAGGISGRGVHEAARISALGAGGEIVASAATLALATGEIRTRAERTVELKGLPGEMEVAKLDFDALV